MVTIDRRTGLMHRHMRRQHQTFILLTSKGYSFKNIFDFTTAGNWDCEAVVERLPALHYSVDFFLVHWDHEINCGTLKLLEGHYRSSLFWVHAVCFYA